MARKLIYVFLLIISACIDPLKVDEPVNNKRLVVDGLITNAPGPYQVKLFYTNKLNTTRLVSFEPVINAQVAIVDDLNQSTLLVEVAPGQYRTNENEITGQVGRSYYVSIKTNTDAEYRSKPQLLKDAGEITNVYFEFEKNALPGNQKDSYVDGLKVFVDAHSGEQGSDLFRWRWTTIHKVRSYPELETRSTPGGEIPNPEPCSGYVRQGGGVVQVGECTCCICWSYNYSEGSYISKSQLVTGGTYNKQNLGKIPVTSMHFFDRYYIEAQQLSLSDEAYDFWNLVEKQQSGTTDLFQPNAIKIRGNIQNVTDETEEVLGFFGVSGVASKSLYIEQEIVPYELPEVEIIRYSCKAFFKNATTDKPWFW